MAADYQQKRTGDEKRGSRSLVELALPSNLIFCLKIKA